MAEVTDIGTAISLGTNLQPDRTQPLTRASNQWLANQMRQDALKAKQQEKMDAKKQTIYSGLTGWGSEFEDLNERSKVLATDVIVNKADAYEKNDIARMAQIDSDYQRNQQELNALAAQRRTELKSVGGTPAEGIKNAIYTNTVPDFINKNLDYANYFEGTDRGAVLVNPPKKVDTGKMLTAVVKGDAAFMPLEVQGSWQQLFSNTYRNQGALKPETISVISEDLVKNGQFLESYYMENRNTLKPLFDKRVTEIAAENPNANIGQIVLAAKQDIARESVKRELNNRNNIAMRASKPQSISVTVNGATNQVSPLNPQNLLGADMTGIITNPDIASVLEESGGFSSEMLKGTKLGTLNWEDGAIRIPLDANKQVANVRTLKGTNEQLIVQPYDIIFAKDATGKEHSFVLLKTSTGLASGVQRNMIVPLEGNMAMLSTLMKDKNHKNAQIFKRVLEEAVEGQYKVPDAKTITINKKTGQVGSGETQTPKSGAKTTPKVVTGKTDNKL
jgi:hypothetical protein